MDPLRHHPTRFQSFLQRGEVLQGEETADPRDPGITWFRENEIVPFFRTGEEVGLGILHDESDPIIRERLSIDLLEEPACLHHPG